MSEEAKQIGCVLRIFGAPQMAVQQAVAGFPAGCREGRKAERRGAARLGGAAPSSLPSTTQGAQSSVLFFVLRAVGSGATPYNDPL